MVAPVALEAVPPAAADTRRAHTSLTHARNGHIRHLRRLQILWNFGVFLTILFGRALQTIFFGPLRLLEIEVRRPWTPTPLVPARFLARLQACAHRLRSFLLQRLHERAWYAVTESLLALTIFREEFDTSFVILFTTLLFLKVFHWLAADRVEMVRFKCFSSRDLRANGTLEAEPTRDRRRWSSNRAYLGSSTFAWSLYSRLFG